MPSDGQTQHKNLFSKKLLGESMEKSFSLLIVRPSRKSPREWIQTVQTLMQITDSQFKVSAFIDPDPSEDFALIASYEQIPFEKSWTGIKTHKETYVVLDEEDRVSSGVPENTPTLPFDLIELLQQEVTAKFSLLSVLTRLQTFIQTITRLGSEEISFAEMISNATRNFLNARGTIYLKSGPHSKTLQIEAKSSEKNVLVTDDKLMLPSRFFREPEFINNPTNLHSPDAVPPEFQNLIGDNPFYLLPIDYHIPSPKHFLLVIPDILEKDSTESTIELKNAIELCFPLLGTSFSLHKNHLALKKRAEFDSMTGSYNRASIEEMLSNEIAQTKLQGNNLSILMIDLDHFKKINDKFGHLAGDDVLIELTKSISEVLRSEDRIGRYGGEEFLVILPGGTTKTAKVIAERILAKVEGLRFIKYPDIRLTVSIGIASYPEHAPHLIGLLSLADQMLYNSKYSGRNRASAPKERTGLSEPGSVS